MRRTSPRSSAPSRRRLARFAVALAALLLAVALPAQAQTETDDPVLSVIVEDGQPPLTIAWSQLAGHLDAPGVSYDQGRQRSPKGIYLDSALELGGLLPQTYSTVLTLDNALQVDKPDLIHQAVVLFRAEDGTLRLLQGAQTDAAGGERWVDAADGTLAVRLRRLPELTPSMTEVNSGGELTFYASIPPQLDPATVTYEWEFNDGRDPQRTTQPFVRRRFQARGRQDTPYNVSLTLYVNGKRYDDMLPLITQIKAVLPEGDKYTGLGAEAGNGRAHSSGRNRNAVRDGTAPSRTDTPAPTPTSGGSGTGTGTGSGGGSDYAGGAAYTPPPVSQSQVTPPPATPSVPRRAPRAARRAPATTTAPPAGETVDGYLLASAEVAPSSAGGRETSARTARAVPQPDEQTLEVPTPVWVAVGLLALVVLGWGLESRTTLPYFRP